MIKKLLSLSKNLFTKTAFLTFAFRSKCRVNKSTSCKKKPRENQYSSSSRKNQEKANNSPSYRCAAIYKLLSLSENLFTKTAFLTFAFRSKCRVNKSTSCKKKPRENQYSSSSRKKTAPQYNSNSLNCKKIGAL